MRSVSIVAAALGACLSCASGARGGVYNTEEPVPVMTPATTFAEFLYQRRKLQELGERERYQKRVAELEKKGLAGTLSTGDRVNLGAYLIRLAQTSPTPEEGERNCQKAIEVLSGADQKNFMVLANLAVAHHLIGQLNRAIDYQEKALAAWPATWPGMDRKQLYWHRRVEKYYLALLSLRHREEFRPRDPGASPSLDELFPKVRFRNAEGRYAAGEIAPAAWAELPPDAVPIVEQILLTMPKDLRLYWLLGELLNAQGEVLVASDIFDTLVQNRFGFEEVQSHRRVLNAARAAMQPKTDPPAAEKTEPASRSETPPTSWLPNLRHVTVSFITGAIVALLVSMQIREFRRRKAP